MLCVSVFIFCFVQNLLWKIKTEKKGKQPLHLAEAHSLPGLPFFPPCASSSPRPSKPRPMPISSALTFPSLPSLADSWGRPFSHRQVGPVEVASSPSSSLFVTEQESSYRINPEISGFPCPYRESRPIKVPRDAPRHAFASKSRNRALAALNSLSSREITAASS